MSQPLEALAKANDVRVASSHTRRELSDLPTDAGCNRVAGWLTEHRPEIEATYLTVVLGSIRGFGKAMTLRTLADVGIPQTRLDLPIRVRDLTERERGHLVSHLCDVAEQRRAA